MPPKKIQKLDQEPGFVHKYVRDTFETFDGNCKIGHVLLKYFDNNCSISKTVSSVSNQFGIVPSHQQIDRLVSRTVKRYKNFSRECNRQKIVKLCDQVFKLNIPLAKEHPGSTFIDSEENNTSNATASSVTSFIVNDNQGCQSYNIPLNVPTPLRAGKTPPTPRRLKLKNRLDFVSKLRSQEKQRYRDHLNSVISNIHRNKIKHLNQSLKRKSISIAVKNATIVKLKIDLNRAEQNRTFTNSDNKFNQMKRNIQRLKLSNKMRRKASTIDENISVKDYFKLQKELATSRDIIAALEAEKAVLEDTVEELKKGSDIARETHEKTFPTNMRMMVYNAIVNNVPTQNIPTLLSSHAKIMNQHFNTIPHRSTVDQMARELGLISDLQSSEIAMETKDITIGFDASTQEGTHINTVHFTTTKECRVVAVDELPGGKAEDYHKHIVDSIAHLANVYSEFHDEEFHTCQSRIISNISNTMTDRLAANHLTILKLNESWNKSLNELNCHLHPLDTIASSCRSALKSCETEKGQLFGKDCLAGNLVVNINKFRFKDSKGDPKGFLTFLSDNGLPRGLIPRYRGNRLHIIFHICGILIKFYDTFLTFFTTGSVTCGSLQSCLKSDFMNKTAVIELKVMGLLGKVLTGPWMKKFYTSVEKQVDHVKGIELVKGVVEELKKCTEDPLAIVTRATDLFGQPLDMTDSTLRELQVQPTNPELYSEMMVACLTAVITVLERQYKRYFSADISEQFVLETKSARSHNMDAEEVMGMFAEAKNRAKHATMCFLSSRMKAKKNKVVPYLDEMLKGKRGRVVDWAVRMAGKARKGNVKKQLEIAQEVSKRAAIKVQHRVEKERRELERTLKTLDVEDLQNHFPELSKNSLDELSDIFTGRVVGKTVKHIWYDEGAREKIVYSGKVDKMNGKTGKYVIAYWGWEDSYDSAIDYDVSKYELGADFINGDVIFC